MPKMNNLKRLLIIGSGPIQIGQACEFDYSGTQACKALMAEGFEVILVNSNPATIMTDPDIATRTYVEPLKTDYLEKIIEKEKPDAIIPTLGGQTALNLALDLDKKGILKKHNVLMLGATPSVIEAAEDREKFRAILDQLGAKYPKSEMVKNFDQGLKAAVILGYPLILRPNYTLGGGGGGIAYSAEEYQQMLAQALHESPTSEVLVEESILGWKEFELEVMRDSSGTFVVVCSIENFDPCGVHTGDSITVAPQQTLTDQEYQAMRDEACKIINKVGVQTGGANIQFAVNPKDGERVVIEMNPRVSRSSALASKATGFPIAKIAALLAVGYQLHELKNDITQVTPTCYEPALDYVVTKIPRFAFEKFQGSKDVLTTQMKSVGEVMAIGRTLQESFMKALASLEMNNEAIPQITLDELKISSPNSQRIWHIFEAFRQGYSLEKLHSMTQITPWFLEQIQDLTKFENEIRDLELTPALLLKAKRLGFTDARIAKIKKTTDLDVRKMRHQQNIRPAYFQVDTCAGEFASSTPYFYSTYWGTPSKMTVDKAVAVIGSGPNRIGQGIEFDYSCVRGVKALQNLDYKVIMINSNPETVSTDYDTSDYLFFEPLTHEHISEVLGLLNPHGFIAQLGGQTPINLAKKLSDDGFKLLGSSLEAIDLAEDRKKFAQVCRDLKFSVPNSAMVGGVDEALNQELKVGYPMICRPSYVLGGRRMEVIENKTELASYFERHGDFISEDNPCLMDQFLAGALEVDVDLVRGEKWLINGGVIEHIEAAGVHSGDSMGVIPPQRLKPETLNHIEKMSALLADKMKVIGHLNLQLAIKDDVVYVLEANPRSSRSVPFLAKATGIPLVDLGIKAQLGLHLTEKDLAKYDWRKLDQVCVKGVVFPFKKFQESDSILGPEMKSTGETMGRADTYSEALVKAFISTSYSLPQSGEVFLSLRDKDKKPLLPLLTTLNTMGFKLSATKGTAAFFKQNGLNCLSLNKVHEGRPHCVDRIRSGQVQFVINTTAGRQTIEASFAIRRACTDYSIPCLTESDAAEAFVTALDQSKAKKFEVSHLSYDYR